MAFATQLHLQVYMLQKVTVSNVLYMSVQVCVPKESHFTPKGMYSFYSRQSVTSVFQIYFKRILVEVQEAHTPQNGIEAIPA